MTSTVLAISVAYVVIAVLLLTLALGARLAWWVKAAAIVVTSAFSSRRSSQPRGCWAGRARAAAAAIPVAVGEGDRARPQERQSGRDLSLDRGGGREQRSRRRAAFVPPAVFAPARG